MTDWPLVIVSGGQTGVDRGALDAALERSWPCGGWCPAGRRAEDGVIPARYPLRELASEDYTDRTQQNVIDSDGTLVLDYPGSGPGTRLTIVTARRHSRPVLVIEAERTALESAIAETRAFLRRHCIRRLNVAGPRASEQPAAYGFARQLLAGVLEDMAGAAGRAGEGPRRQGQP